MNISQPAMSLLLHIMLITAISTSAFDILQWKKWIIARLQCAETYLPPGTKYKTPPDFREISNRVTFNWNNVDERSVRLHVSVRLYATLVPLSRCHSRWAELSTYCSQDIKEDKRSSCTNACVRPIDGTPPWGYIWLKNELGYQFASSS